MKISPRVPSEYSPVRKIAKASETGHATNIIAGLAIGQHATALPVIFIGASIWVSFACGGLYGIAIAVMAMLSMAGIIISLDAFGPITDIAGGIATMSEMPKEIRTITDELDAVAAGRIAAAVNLRHQLHLDIAGIHADGRGGQQAIDCRL